MGQGAALESPTSHKANVKWEAAKWGTMTAGHAPLTFVRLGRGAWKGAKGPLPRQDISILPRALLRGPIATTLLCCGPKVSWPRGLPGPWAPIWWRKDVDKAQRRQTTRKVTTPGVPGSLPSHCPLKGHSPGAGPPLGVLCKGSLSAPGPSRLSQPGSPGKTAPSSSSSSSSSLSDE